MFILRHPDRDTALELADQWFLDQDFVGYHTPSDVITEIAERAIDCFSSCSDFVILPYKSWAVDTVAAYVKELLRGHPGLTGNFSTVVDYVAGEIAEKLVVEVD